MPTPDQDVLDVKPLRTLAPMFPAPLGVNTYNHSTSPPLIFVTPAGHFQGGFGDWNNSAAKSFFAFGSKDACVGKAHTFGDQNADDGKAATFGDQSVDDGKADTFGGKDAAGSQNADIGDQDCAGGQPAAHWSSDVSANANGPIDVTPISAYRATQPSVISLDDDDDDDDDDNDENYVANHTSASGRKIKRPSRLSGYNMNDGLGTDSSSSMKIKRPKPSHKKTSADNEHAMVPPSGDPREIV